MAHLFAAAPESRKDWPWIAFKALQQHTSPLQLPFQAEQRQLGRMATLQEGGQQREPPREYASTERKLALTLQILKTALSSEARTSPDPCYDATVQGNPQVRPWRARVLQWLWEVSEARGQTWGCPSPLEAAHPALVSATNHRLLPLLTPPTSLPPLCRSVKPTASAQRRLP